MITVFKYEIPMTIKSVIPLPAGAEILHVAAQGDVPMLWARVDTEAPIEPRRFLFLGTGFPFPDDAGGYEHIGSMLVRDGALVWHLFEKRAGREEVS